MKALIHEPLVHFLALGLLLSGAWAVVHGPTTGAEEQITVSAAQVEQFAASFRMTWQRPPTESELAGLIENYLKEEIYYREAQALGFDRDDPVIRRRMRQKLEFLTSDVATAVEPSNDELQRFLDEDPERFRQDPRLSFQHVYFSVDRRGASAADDARAALAASRGDLDASTVGDPFVLPLEFQDLTATQVSGYFGGTFTDQLLTLDPGSWQGPVESGYGVHLVRVLDRTDGRVPPLDQIRDEVRREFLALRRRETEESVYRGLRERYAIDIEWPEGMEPLDITGVGRTRW